jgi:hypothetical protein
MVKAPGAVPVTLGDKPGTVPVTAGPVTAPGAVPVTAGARDPDAVPVNCGAGAELELAPRGHKPKIASVCASMDNPVSHVAVQAM